MEHRYPAHVRTLDGGVLLKHSLCTVCIIMYIYYYTYIGTRIHEYIEKTDPECAAVATDQLMLLCNGTIIGSSLNAGCS